MEEQQKLEIKPVTPATKNEAPREGNAMLSQLIKLAIEKEASDIHFGEGRKISLRVKGKFVFIENIPPLKAEEAEAMVRSMFGNGHESNILEMKREVDFSYTHSTGVNFRVNAFYQRGRLSAVMKAASKHIPTMQELGTPESFRKFLFLKEGLILITGPAGSGKSTTVQALLEHVNETAQEHILTIENPIERLFEDKKSFFSQRELGKDTLSFATALGSADHEDADIVMVSEISNMETLDAVLTAVETGHLVIANMTTRNARQTIERIFSLYSSDQQEQVRDRLADNLVAILSQDLLPRADENGHVAMYEVLVNTPPVRRVIRSANTNQIENAIRSGGEEAVTLADYAYRLYEQGIISEDTMKEYTNQE